MPRRWNVREISKKADSAPDGTGSQASVLPTTAHCPLTTDH